MNELFVLMKKDLRLLISESYFPIVILAIVALSGVAAFSAATDYSFFIQGPPMTLSIADKELKQLMCLLDFWKMVIPIEVLILLMVSSLTLSMEKENGMLRFILAYGKNRSLIFISKSLVVAMVSLIAVLIPALAFLLGIYTMGQEVLIDAGLMLASAAFPLLIMLSVSMLGILISSLSKKRHTAVIIAVMAFLVITGAYTSALEGGMIDASLEYHQEHIDQFMTNADARMLFPEDKKLMLLLNPLLMQEGLLHVLNLTGGEMNLAYVEAFAFYDEATDASIGIIMASSLFLMGYVSFMRYGKR